MDTTAQDPEVARLRTELASATEAACAAYRDSGRLVRVLNIISQPSSPKTLMDDALNMLSQSFNADLVTVVRLVNDRLVATRSCGLPEDDDAFSFGWSAGPAALTVLGGGGAIARSGEALRADGDVPDQLAGLGLNSAAWIPLWNGPDRGEKLLVLFRRSSTPVTGTELRMLESVAFRLGLAFESRERGFAAERLAEFGHRLSRHLDLSSLFTEAAMLFADLIRADSTWIVEPDGQRAVLRAAHGSAPHAPESLTDLPGWEVLASGRPYFATWPSERSLVALPILHDGTTAALLYAFRDPRRPFLAETVETLSVFATYLHASMVNAELYHALRRSEASLRLVTDSISDLVAVVNSAGAFVYASPSHERELAHDATLLLGADITDLAHPEDVQGLRTALEHPGQSSKVEYRLQTGWETWVWVESALRPAPSADGAVVISSRVIDDRKRLEDELRRRATHDPLTGLANRVLAGERLAQALARDDSSLVGLLFCDLDKFKAVNDRLGHEAGDELLRLVAGRLRRCLRHGDLLARFGGDEFVFLLEEVADLADVYNVGQRVIDAFEPPLLLRGEWYHLSVSIGGVCGSRGQTTASAMLRDADAAMYSAKDQGHGIVEVFDEAASHRSLDRLDLRSDLLRALERNQLTPYYQPIFDLASGRITAFEALLRWQHPVRGLIPPDVFIPLAEETGAIIPIGDWVLDQACQQLATWQRLPRWQHLGISVNLSATQLHEPGLGERTLSAITDSGVDPADVWLEVTEHSAVRTDVTDLATALRRAGVHFSLDDFGISYSNLGHLTRFPVECLKIDRSFVRGITDSEPDRDIVRAVLAIAGSLGLKVVAEGIERAEQRRELLRLGCRLGQGYLLSRPVPPAEATDLLVNGARLTPIMKRVLKRGITRGPVRRKRLPG